MFSSWWFRLWHKPSFEHRYSSVRMYFCKTVVMPVVRGKDIYLPVRWFNADIGRVLSDANILPLVRKALMYR